MFLAGGTCFLVLGRLRRWGGSWVQRAALGAGMITGVELVTGLLVNRQYQVWDYRHQPGNFLGQVCPVFAAVWAPLSVAGMLLYDWAERSLMPVSRG